MKPHEIAFEIAQELGFDLAGIAPLEAPHRAGEFQTWLEEGRHGSMEYLERQKDRILDPSRVLPDARSLLILGLGHARAPLELEGGARVARYAAGRDYHNWISKRLQNLRRRLEALGLRGPYRGIVDAGPIMERAHAAAAGIGAESKAANLLSTAHGPWFFLGELLLGEELEPGPGPSNPPGMTLPNCGTCTACIDACPTEAIVAPGQVDARRCISYLTIEHRGPIEHDLRASLGPWVFGCDVCSEVCPWGSDAPDASALLGTHAAFEAPEGSPLTGWLTHREGFSVRFNGSPLQRPRREGLARNAAIVLGNLPSDEGREALLIALAEDPAGVVRAAAAWGLLRGHGDDAGVRGAIERALERERDEAVRRDFNRTIRGPSV